MPEMSPEEMQAMQPQEESQGGGEATALVKQVGEGLAKLAEMLEQSGAATDQDKQVMSQVLSGFTSLVEKNLAQGPGQDAPPEEEPMPSEVPAMGGAKGVPMGPHSRM